MSLLCVCISFGGQRFGSSGPLHTTACYFGRPMAFQHFQQKAKKGEDILRAHIQKNKTVGLYIFYIIIIIF